MSLWRCVDLVSTMRLLATALTDLPKGRDTSEILSWIEGRPAALPFWMACHWLDISPLATLERLERVAANAAPTTSRRGLWGTARRGGDERF